MLSNPVTSVARLALLFVTACGGTSPYDSAWVSSEIGKRAGHAVPTRNAPGRGPKDRFVPTLPTHIASLQGLTEDDAVSVALWNSASFRSDLAQLGLSRADLTDAAAIPNPNLSFLLPISTRQYELSAQYPVAALLQRPWRIAAAKYDVERTARGLVQNGLDAIRDVRLAWAELEASQVRVGMRARAAETMKASAALARSRFQTGDVSALEADLVEAESLAANELAGRSLRERDISRVRLRMLLGVAESALGEQIEVKATDGPTDLPDSILVHENAALASRPDLRAVEIAMEAAGERNGLEKARIVQLFARLDAKPVGPAGGKPILWLPGVTGDIPIFNQNQAGRARAEAEIARVAWAYLAMRQQVLTDVRTAYAELTMALASREPWTKTIVPLQERNVAVALRAYESGGESYLVVLEANRRLVDAQLREVELKLDVRRGRARLDRAVGWRIHASR